MIDFSISSGRCRIALTAAWLILAASPAVATALRPAEITPEQGQTAPYRDSGRMWVHQGIQSFIGTASYVRRYTGLTAGHILFSAKTGLSTNLSYAAALYIESTDYVEVSAFAVLSGYQAAADQNPDSDAAFDQDMGYMIFNKPALNDEWANWSANPGALLTNGPFLAFGYAAQSFDGDELASVQHQTPYFQELGPAFYANQAYYTEGGMSGGPVYIVPPFGQTTMVAINVAGTDYNDPAFSGVRAITSAESPLLLSAEYDHGIITGGVIKGPTTMPAATAANFKTGLIFIDGQQVGNSIAMQYDGDVKLVAKGPYKKTIVITKHKPGKYYVALPAGIPSGTQIPLELLRTALPSKSQKPLQTLTVTVQ